MVVGLFSAVSRGSLAADVKSIPEPPIKAKGEVGAYLQVIHDRVHRRWSKNFVWALVPGRNPFNDASLRVAVRINVLPSGVIQSADVTVHSGLAELDDLAVSIVRESGPWPPLPASARSDDGQGYFEWNFYRDHRLCSDIRTVSREDAVEDAVPRYLAKKKDADAWRRVAAVAKTEPDPVLSWFARLWLKRALGEPATARAAAAGLLAAGDQSSLAVVQQTLQQGGAESAMAAQAFVKAKLPLCPLIKDNLTKDPGPAQEAAVAALAFSLEKDCVPGLGAVAGNAKVAMAVRMSAIKTLSDSPAPAALDALGALKNDPAPGVRSAAILAGVRPGSGRATVYKLIPFLKDPNVDVRAAASAGVVRAAGDAELGQLYLLFKESDPRPYEMVAAELGRSATAATAQLLGKMLKKDDQRVRVAAARALATRTDDFARSLLASVAGDTNPEVKAFAVASGGLTVDAGRQLLAASPADARKLYPQLAIGPSRPIAAAWLVQNFAGLDAVGKVEVLGQWLAGAPPGTANYVTP